MTTLYQPSLFNDAELTYSVRAIPKKDTHWFLLNVHYARRLPPLSYAFGLFFGDELKGVVTYGLPASSTLCVGICGEEYKDNVLELNRLCLMDNKPNEASRLVSASLKLLPQPTVVVSYADTAQEHTGYIYQATNFIYTGLSAPRTDWMVRGLEHMHSKTISDLVANKGKSRIEAIKEEFGDRFYYKERSRKHRYIYFIGNKTQKKAMREALRYQVLPYPKGSDD